MQVTQAIVYTDKRSLVSPSQAIIAGAGLGGILVTVTHLVPWLTAVVSVIYCLFVPALLLQPLVTRQWYLGWAQFRPHLPPIAVTLALVLALIPTWMVILSLLWMLDRNLSEGQVTWVLVGTIGAISALLWRSPVSIRVDMHSLVRRHLGSVLLLEVGLVLGLIVAVVYSYF